MRSVVVQGLWRPGATPRSIFVCRQEFATRCHVFFLKPVAASSRPLKGLETKETQVSKHGWTEILIACNPITSEPRIKSGRSAKNPAIPSTRSQKRASRHRPKNWMILCFRRICAVQIPSHRYRCMTQSVLFRCCLVTAQVGEQTGVHCWGAAPRG
jgi:hypothetical protein